jgi:hypothetical protein
MTSVQGTLLRIVSQPMAIELPPVALKGPGKSRALPE